jgi:DNA-binding transcriptional MerR regulator
MYGCKLGPGVLINLAWTTKDTAIKMISIGHFSRLSGLSIWTLHLYDELDVLVPAFIDPHTNYRRYSLDQLGLAHQICALRAFGSSLPEIRLLLQKPNEVQAQLKRHRRELFDELEAVQDKLNVLGQMIAEQRDF